MAAGRSEIQLASGKLEPRISVPQKWPFTFLVSAALRGESSLSMTPVSPSLPRCRSMADPPEQGSSRTAAWLCFHLLFKNPPGRALVGLRWVRCPPRVEHPRLGQGIPGVGQSLGRNVEEAWRGTPPHRKQLLLEEVGRCVRKRDSCCRRREMILQLCGSGHRGRVFHKLHN